VAKAQVASAEAALLSAKFVLEDTEIWAPIDGVVANRKTRVGEYVTAGTRMLSIVPVDNLWIEANYRETQVGRMKIGDPARGVYSRMLRKPDGSSRHSWWTPGWSTFASMSASPMPIASCRMWFVDFIE
jgi:multidrug efflux pump subunit AcrA (membrane-fusion protein)